MSCQLFLLAHRFRAGTVIAARGIIGLADIPFLAFGVARALTLLAAGLTLKSLVHLSFRARGTLGCLIFARSMFGADIGFHLVEMQRHRALGVAFAALGFAATRRAIRAFVICANMRNGMELDLAADRRHLVLEQLFDVMSFQMQHGRR